MPHAVQEQKHREAAADSLRRQQEAQCKLAAITARQAECVSFVGWLSKQVETQLAEKAGRRIVLPPELLM